jgi:hypothetical protein
VPPTGGDEQERDRRAKRQQLLDHHCDAGELLVEQGRPAEHAGRLIGIRRVERLEAKDQDVTEDLACGEETDGNRDALGHGRLSAPRGIDDLSPNGEPGQDEECVLEIV